MAFTPPTPEQICHQFPEFRSADFLQRGGFKAVYCVKSEEMTEAFKIVQIPYLEGEEYAEEFREESMKRVMREVQVLGECESPHLVKLGSISPTGVEFGNDEFVAYSEEYLERYHTP